MAKKRMNYTLFGGILSDGSFHYRLLNNPHLQKSFNYKSTDILNHPVWTGQVFKEQTEVSVFIDRLIKK